MASPQRENGFTAIANEIMEALAKQTLTQYEWRVLMGVLRLLYGWQRTEAPIALSLLAKMTGVPRQHCARALRGLMAKNIIAREGSVTRFIKDHELWISGTSTGSTSTGTTSSGTTCTGSRGGTSTGTRVVPPQVPKVVPLQVPSKERKKDIKKEEKERGFLFEEIISHLNQRTGKRFRHQTEAYRQLIRARLGEGFTVEDFKLVHHNMAAEWKDTDMDRYLQPTTLYRASKFQGYLNRKPALQGMTLAQERDYLAAKNNRQSDGWGEDPKPIKDVLKEAIK